MPNPAWACALCHLAPPDVARSRKKRDLCDLCEPGLAARGLAWCAKGHRASVDGMAANRPWCLACERKRKEQYVTDESLARKRRASQEWYQKNREVITARRNTPDRRARQAEWHRLWYARNGERKRAEWRAYYRANSEKVRAAVRAWRKQNQEQDRERRREQYQRRKLAILHSWRRAA